MNGDRLIRAKEIFRVRLQPVFAFFEALRFPTQVLILAATDSAQRLKDPFFDRGVWHSVCSDAAARH